MYRPLILLAPPIWMKCGIVTASCLHLDTTYSLETEFSINYIY